MRKRWRDILVVSLSIAVIALIAVHANGIRERKILEAQIDTVIREYNEGDVPYIDFKSINAFSWDKVYIFGPYSDCKNITKALGAKSFWLECKLSSIEEYEGSSLFVFTNKHSVVQHTMYFGVTIAHNTNDGIVLDEARFILDNKGRMIWVENK